MRNAEVLNAIANDDFQTELGPVQHRDQRPAAQADRRQAPDELETDAAGQPQRRRGARALGRRAHRDDRHPADPRPRAPHPRVAQREPALRADQRADLRRRAARTSRSTSTASSGWPPSTDTIAPEAACTSRPVPPAGQPAAVRRAPGTPPSASPASRWRSVRTRPFLYGKELWRETRIALFEQATDTRPRGAEGPGRASAGLVRRALDHLDLRPVRGERALLPVAAADRRRRGPGRGARPG